MICQWPVQRDVKLFACGRCLPCRINKQREWVGRLEMELKAHLFTSFVTLTYADEALPTDLCVKKREVQLFLKRLRMLIPKRRIRYFACGEYGSDKARPHYHLILYGIHHSEGYLIKEAWTENGLLKGRIQIGPVQRGGLAYCLSYVTKGQIGRASCRERV